MNTFTNEMELFYGLIRKQAWIDYHPPPSFNYGTEKRRPRGVGPPPRGVPCPGLDPEKLAGGTGYLQDLRQPDMEWIGPVRAENTPPSGRTWI